MYLTKPQLVILIASGIASSVLLIKLWRSDDSKIIKIGLSVIAPIPVLGPLALLWVMNWPSRQPPGLQNPFRRGEYFFRMWPILSDKNEKRRKRRLQQLASKDRE